MTTGNTSSGTFYFFNKKDQTVPIVFIHGVGLTYEIWQPQLDFFKDRSTLSYDILGHGKSSLNKQNISFDDFSDQLINLINELKIDKIHLIGFSIGSLIARNFATKFNDRLQSLGKKITVFNAFDAANDVLLNSVQGIVELITVPGVINLDFADVKAVMGKKGRSIMGSAVASGPDRARLAVEKAINSPLLEDINLEGASGILLNVTVGSDLEISEFNQIGDIVQGYAAEKSKVIVGTALSNDLENDSIRVTLVATGLNTEKPNQNKEENRERSFDDLDRPITARNGLRQQKTQDMFESFKETTSSGDQDEELLDIPRFLKRQEKQDPEKRQEKQDPDLDF